jgi:hypothetical protein
MFTEHMLLLYSLQLLPNESSAPKSESWQPVVVDVVVPVFVLVVAVFVVTVDVAVDVDDEVSVFVVLELVVLVLVAVDDVLVLEVNEVVLEVDDVLVCEVDDVLVSVVVVQYPHDRSHWPDRSQVGQKSTGQRVSYGSSQPPQGLFASSHQESGIRFTL